MTAKLYKFPNNYCPPTKTDGTVAIAEDPGTLGSGFRLPLHLRGADSVGRSEWSLVYYLDSESRVCALHRCSGVLEAGLVITRLDVLGNDWAAAERLTIVPVPFPSSKNQAAANLEYLENAAGYPPGIIEQLQAELLRHPKPQLTRERGYFFVKSGTSRLHQAVSNFRDWMAARGSDIGLALIMAIMVRLLLVRRGARHA